MMAVLVSERARTTVLSTSVIFLVAGFAIGSGGFRLVPLTSTDPLVESFASLALFTILFVGGTELPLNQITAAWRLPGRALLLGLPLTLGFVAVAGRSILGLSWVEALLVGAILSPTDPVFVAAILEREAVPLRLRRLLSVESGLNDGLALPLVMVLLAIAGHQPVHPVMAVGQALLGILIGITVPMTFIWLDRRRWLAASDRYRPLAGVAIASVLIGLSEMLGTNSFLAAFAGGSALATLQPKFASSFQPLGRPVAEALKLATLLVLGAVLSLPSLVGTGWSGLAFSLVTLLAARPAALVLAFAAGGLSRKEWLAAAWFGPKGFASLLYALLMLNAGIPRAPFLFRLVALVVVLSIIAHSSSDVAVARVFSEEEARVQGRRRAVPS